jgi:hypothetical protein
MDEVLAASTSWAHFGVWSMAALSALALLLSTWSVSASRRRG